MKARETPAIVPKGIHTHAEGDVEGARSRLDCSTQERATDRRLDAPLKETEPHATGIEPRHTTTHPLRIAPD